MVAEPHDRPDNPEPIDPAGLGVGLWKSESDIRRVWRAQRVFEPKLRDRSERLRLWREAVART